MLALQSTARDDTSGEPAPLPPPRKTILHTASSFACSRATAELGEDYAELAKIDRAYRLLERRLTRAALHLQTRDAISTVTEFNL